MIFEDTLKGTELIARIKARMPLGESTLFNSCTYA
jgi:hypothetical protein